MSTKSTKLTKQQQQQQQQQSRDNSQSQSSKAKESKSESKQPTNIEFRLPGLLDLSILTPKHFQVIGKKGNRSSEFRCPISIKLRELTFSYTLPLVTFAHGLPFFSR